MTNPEKASQKDLDLNNEPLLELTRFNNLGDQKTPMRGSESIEDQSSPREKCKSVRRMKKKLSFCCKYCDKIFSSKQALGGHQNAHRGERTLFNNAKATQNNYVSSFEYDTIFSTPYIYLGNASNHIHGQNPRNKALHFQRDSMIHKPSFEAWSRGGHVPYFRGWSPQALMHQQYWGVDHGEFQPSMMYNPGLINGTDRGSFGMPRVLPQCTNVQATTEHQSKRIRISLEDDKEAAAKGVDLSLKL